MDTKYPLRLKEYSFPVQSVRANPEFRPQDERDGAKIAISFEFGKVDDDDVWIADLKISTDETEGTNPPYFFEIQAFGIFEMETGADEQVVTTSGRIACFQVLAGAIREHIATLTSRAPWGVHFVNIIPIRIKPAT